MSNSFEVRVYLQWMTFKIAAEFNFSSVHLEPVFRERGMCALLSPSLLLPFGGPLHQGLPWKGASQSAPPSLSLSPLKPLHLQEVRGWEGSLPGVGGGGGGGESSSPGMAWLWSHEVQNVRAGTTRACPSWARIMGRYVLHWSRSEFILWTNWVER